MLHHRLGRGARSMTSKVITASPTRLSGGPTTETIGVLIAVLSSTFGGMAGAVTRFVVGSIDPVTIAAFRFGIGVVVLLPLALILRSAFPPRRDWLAVALLGVMFFAVFFGFYNIELDYTTAARGALAVCLVAVAAASGGFAVAQSFTAGQWIAVLYLGVFGGAAAFFLWVLALRMTTPTRVANTMTINPIAASLLAAVLVHEPIGWNLVIGLIAVVAGIWLASTSAKLRWA